MVINKISCIYVILCLANNKIYVGSSIDFKRRKYKHKGELKKNIHVNKHLQAAWNKYGSEKFKWFKLELVNNTDNLIEREQYWLDLLKPEFNKNKTAGSQLGFKHSDETKRKIALASKGNKHSLGKITSKETKLKLSQLNKGKNLSIETKNKISKSLEGKLKSKEHCENLSKAKKRIK